MSMRTPDLIHALTFDFSFATVAQESVELADWVKGELLPVIEEVLDQCFGPGGRRRIERLEIDLGTVVSAHARSELPRRLFAQLSMALRELPDEVSAIDTPAGRAPEQGSALLEFLRTGKMPWAAAWDAHTAHTKLLRQVLDSPQGHALLSEALRDDAMLTRLIRQFDSEHLLAVARTLLSNWPEEARLAALTWANDELQRLQGAGGDGETFWRWFLAQHAVAVSPQALLAGWDAARRGGPRPGDDVIAEAAAFTVAELRIIEQGLDSANFALLSAYWDRILTKTPELVRRVHPQRWQLWLEHFDANTMADIFGVVQRDCGWLIERLASVVPRLQINAALRPAMVQWLAAPPDTLAPQLVFDWIKDALPESVAGVDAFPFTGEVMRDIAVGPNLQALAAPVSDRRRQGSGIVGMRSAFPTYDRLDVLEISSSEMANVEKGLEAANFSLLAPYWDRMVTEAPDCIRRAHPQFWQLWLRHFDDDTLADIFGVVQRDCAPLVERLGAAIPRDELHVALGPAIAQWLAAPQDSIAPQLVLDWIRGALSFPEEVLRAFTVGRKSVVHSDNSRARLAPVGKGGRPGTWVPTYQSPVTLAISLNDMAIIETALETADFALLELYWDRILAHAPDCLRRTHPQFWQLWLQHFGADTLADIFGVVQRECGRLIEHLATVIPRSQINAALRPAMTQWLAAPQDSVALQPVFDWIKAAFPELGASICVSTDTDDVMRDLFVGRNAQDLAAPFSDKARAALAPVGMRCAFPTYETPSQAAAATVANRDHAGLRVPIYENAGTFSISLSDMAIIEKGLATADFALLAPYWDRILAEAPRYLRRAHPQRWQLWLQHFDADTLADIFRVVQRDCAQLIERLESAIPRAELNAALRPAMAHWLAAAQDSIGPQLMLDWMKGALPELAARLETFPFPGVTREVAVGRNVQVLPAPFSDNAHAALAPVGKGVVHKAVPTVAAALFAQEELALIQQGLADARFDLLAPFWQRLLAGAGQWLCGEHPQRWRTWLVGFSDDVLIDILSVTQPDCTSMFERICAVVTREHLLPLVQPALPLWFSAAPGRLSPRDMLMYVMKSAPHHADALAALGETPEHPVRVAASDQGMPVDSKHFREALRALGPSFARAEIITISKCLNAGECGPLAPYWDRLLVLAPHWLRSEYPRLARTWLAGFDDAVLIDILAVVQADCCALIECLAGVLPCDQLHALLRPSLASWFDVGVDCLASQTIMDVVQRAMPDLSADHLALRDESAATTYDRPQIMPAAPEAASLGLEDLLLRGEAGELRALWPSILMSRRAELRQIWSQLSFESREHAIARFATELSVAQQLDAAVMLQPTVTMLVAELQHLLEGRPDSAAVLNTALQCLMHADVASADPDSLMRHLVQHHADLLAVLRLADTRHIRAALPPMVPTPAGQAQHHLRLALGSAQLSQAAWRAFLDGGWREQAQFGQLDSAQLHALVRAWVGFQQAEKGPSIFLATIEARALCAASPHAFFGKVLRQAMLDEPIELDAICDPIVPATVFAPLAVVNAPAQHLAPDNALAHATYGPLPALLLQALPQRLADAFLRADLSALDAIWPAIVIHHPALLAQAARRYLGRAEARSRLLLSADPGKVRDLLGCLSAWAGQLVAPLLDHPARFSVTLPAALTPDVFVQRVLRFAFGEAVELQGGAAPAGWVAGLLQSVFPAPSQQSDSFFAQLGHTWYEMLRDGGTQLETALEHALLGNAYLEATLARLQNPLDCDAQASLPDVLQHMLTAQLCSRHPALTDRLLGNGGLAHAQASTFSAAEWQALAAAQMPRQARTAQLAFWREVSARLPGHADILSASEQEVQVAFAAAFGVLREPIWQADDVASVAGTPADAAQSAASADTIAILLMRDSAPDHCVTAGITLLTQRLLANATGCEDRRAFAALQSALAHGHAIERLFAVLPVPTLARLLCVLQPGLAAALPAVLRALADVVPVPLSAVPVTLDRSIWRAIFDAVFASEMPNNAIKLAAALGRQLAGDQTQDGPDGASVANVALTDPPAAAATPAAAMAAMMQPLVQSQPAKLAARMVRHDEEPLPFAGDANLRNAGLVIVAPYIERLFALLDITRDGAFICDESRQRAVHLLQYVVTAEESTPEYLLGLNKLLCGLPAAVPLVAGISITDKEKDTIDQMLKGVIAHWSAIGASSVTGLRETFLQREGCLYYQEDAWHLKIPQRTFDMLLDRLPWGYKLIKFSWMAAPLNVAWR